MYSLSGIKFCRYGTDQTGSCLKVLSNQTCIARAPIPANQSTPGSSAINTTTFIELESGSMDTFSCLPNLSEDQFTFHIELQHTKVSIAPGFKSSFSFLAQHPSWRLGNCSQSFGDTTTGPLNKVVDAFEKTDRGSGNSTILLQGQEGALLDDVLAVGPRVNAVWQASQWHGICDEDGAGGVCCVSDLQGRR